MKILPGIVSLSLLGCLSARAYTVLSNNVYQSDGTTADTQAAVNAALDGFTIQIPPGAFAWTTGISVSGKAIKIQGAGAGSLQGHSTTSVTVGTGPQTFTTQSNLAFQAGQTVRANCTAQGIIYMEGTVASYSGTTLVLNITTTAGSGTIAFWTFSTPPTTTISNSCTAGPVFSLTEAASGHVELTGIYIFATGSNTAVGDGVDILSASSGQPVFIHDCRFSVASVGARAVETRSNRGLVYKCSFDNKFDAGVTNNGNGNNDQGISFKCGGLTSSWTNNATMGMADTNGTSNFYVEDCYFAGFWTQGLDFDDNSRAVVRYCTFDNAATASHGADTSPYGLRHFELYNNTFVFVNAGTNTFNLNWWLFLRGGTGIITDNEMPDITSSQWGNKSELSFTVMNLRRNSGPYACWSGGYPAPHQIGQGWISGSATEPVYIWNNTGTGNFTPTVSDYSCASSDACLNCSTLPSATNYCVSSRDFVLGSPKPGYVKYTYPHPLRTGAPMPPPNLRLAPK